MTEFHGPRLDAHIPDDLTVAQFVLDGQHSLRPHRPLGVPWTIDDSTGRKIGFEEVRARTFGLANALSMRFGTKEDDIILIYSPNHVDYGPAMWAAHRLGAVVSAANPGYSVDELSYQLEVAKPSVIITHRASINVALEAARLSGLPAERVVLFGHETLQQLTTVDALVDEGLAHRPSFVERKLRRGEAKQKLAFLNFSSGTTGKPKAVMINHYSVIGSVLQLAFYNHGDAAKASQKEHRFRPGDLLAAATPFYHIYGLFMLHAMSFIGVTLVVIPRFSFKDFLDSIVKYRITHLPLVPPQVVMLCKQPLVKNYDLSHVRMMSCGAAPLSGELMMQLAEDFPAAHIGQGFGMTEAVGTIAMFSVDHRVGVVGSSGQLFAGFAARVVRPDGSLAGPGEPGELWLKSPFLATGYLNNPEATKETFVDGWLRTGDEVIIDENNEVFIIDRIKELIKVRGFQVAPAELEGTLLLHPDVADACVVGIPDEYSGEVPLAFVVLRPEPMKRAASSQAESDRIKEGIIKHASENKVAYKRLAGGVEFTDVIPKNPSGKILRRVVRDKVKQARAKL